MTPIAAWLLALMTWKAAPARMAALPQFKGYEESASEKQARYEAFASDIERVAFDVAETPLFGGSDGRARTAVVILSVAYHEGGWALDVDLGPCAKIPGRCDGGLSACTMQIRIGTGTTAEGWTQADLFGDRRKCFRAGMHRLQRSFRSCAKLGSEHSFDAYAAGKCIPSKASSELADTAKMFARHAPIPGPDTLFMLTPSSAPTLTFFSATR